MPHDESTKTPSSKRVWCVTLLVMIFAASPLAATPFWLLVTHTTKRTGATYYSEVVKTQAEQATLPTDHKRKGDYGPTTLHTRRLQFICRDKTYEMPDPFVEDLPWLGVDSSVRASLNGNDAVFTMTGDSGEKVYTVHFHFRDGRFFQRILDYGEFHTILIRTNDIITGR